MTERSRRYAKRPKAFAATFASVTALAVIAVAGLAHWAGAPI